MSRMRRLLDCSDNTIATAIGETNTIPTNVCLSVRWRTVGPSALAQLECQWTASS